MPEPIVLVIGGMALYSWWKQRNAPADAANPPALPIAPAETTAGAQPLGTLPGSALATNTTVANQGAAPLAIAHEAIPVPSDLVAALDNDTALKMRAYAALNPADFQAFLDRYADRIVLRNDLYIEAINNPPEQGFEVTPGMLAGMGTAAYKVGQALNGVYVGRSVDIFGLSASVAGQLPGLNQDFVSSLQGLAMGYRALTSFQQVATIAANAGVEITNLTALTQLGGAAGAYPGLAALPLSGVLMGVGLVVDIGFTIISDKPDLQKAVDVALDVASLAVLFIPVIGVVIAIVIQLVKFIIDLFGEQLFGGGMSHEQREILETARYGENLNPMFPQLADAYTPRELWRTIVQWGSGYCGGTHVVAMSVVLVLRAGDTFLVGGQPWTVPPELDGITFGFGDNEQAGGCYWIKSMPGPLPNITNDEQAWILGALAPINGVLAGAQAGIADWRKEQFEGPTEQLIMARATPMREFLIKHKLTLDQCDQIALEYRAQPHLNALANAYGWPTWQEHFASLVATEWQAFIWSNANASLSDFAKAHGYPTMYAFRASALSTFESYFARAEQAASRLYQNALQAQQELTASLMWQQQQMSMSAP